MRVISGGLDANWTPCMKGGLRGLLCPAEKTTRSTATRLNINFSKNPFGFLNVAKSYH